MGREFEKERRKGWSAFNFSLDEWDYGIGIGIEIGFDTDFGILKVVDGIKAARCQLDFAFPYLSVADRRRTAALWYVSKRRS